MRNRFYSSVTTLLVMMLMLLGCSTLKHQPTTTTNVVTVVKDSLVIHQDTVRIDIPIERYVDVVPVYDTLRLETSLAKSEAYVDTLTHTLKGNLEHKPNSLKTEIKYVERTRIEYRDSLVTKEVPVEVEVIKTKVPRWCWNLLVFDILAVIALGVLVYFRLKGILKL